MKQIGIIGAGHVLMGDDAIGIKVIEYLKEGSFPKNVRIIDIGTSGMSLLHAFSSLDAAIIVDAVEFGGKPGEARRFAPEDATSIKITPGVSTHESDILHLIKLSRNMGECPEKIVIYAIQPANVSNSMELSPELKKRLPDYANEVREILEKL